MPLRLRSILVQVTLVTAQQLSRPPCRRQPAKAAMVQMHSDHSRAQMAGLVQQAVLNSQMLRPPQQAAAMGSPRLTTKMVSRPVWCSAASKCSRPSPSLLHSAPVGYLGLAIHH